MFDSLLDRLVAGQHDADRRGSELREAVALKALLDLDGTLHPIDIGNISAGGLMASLDAELAPGTRLAVLLDGQRLKGEVRWQHAGRFGMCFDEPPSLDPAMIARYRAANVEASKQMSRWMI
ncbi:PilZ domain-containing protein [Sphingoaurantiacus capsulatus]|uniref:PilZ domain-containing protein n=1 Tax=Sphingoaurantiacus capsulatus TaxID=1771310 RepID=A0ABV7X9V9_9SPHN